MPLKEILKRIKQNTSSFNLVSVDFRREFGTHHPYLYIELIEVRPCDTATLNRLFRYPVADSTDYDFDLYTWKGIGDAITHNPYVTELNLFVNDIDHSPDAERCIEALCQKVKNNSTIEKLILGSASIHALNMLNKLSYFVQHNEKLRYLFLQSVLALTADQITLISAALADRRTLLREYSIAYCRFDNEHTFQQVLAAAHSKVQSIELACETNYQYTTLASLLRDPTTELQAVRLVPMPSARQFDERVAASEITASLVGNTKLKDLVICFLSLGGEDMKCFDKLLCDVSSIESICSNSNHTLEKIEQPGLSSFVKECLELNKNNNKQEVARNKVLQYYFIGEFDVAPFANMPLSVVPEVMGQDKIRNRHSAIFRLLKCIPDLCNVS
ncbi:hypothetical protein ACHAXN_008776 [Cyclotella atomus]